jgi:hypothetical protein
MPPKVVPIGPRKNGGGFGLPYLLAAAAAICVCAIVIGFLTGAWVARWPQRVIEVPKIVDVPVPYPVEHDKVVPYEVKVYYPVKVPGPPEHGACPSIAEALNMFEFLELHGKP